MKCKSPRPHMGADHQVKSTKNKKIQYGWKQDGWQQLIPIIGLYDPLSDQNYQILHLFSDQNDWKSISIWVAYTYITYTVEPLVSDHPKYKAKVVAYAYHDGSYLNNINNL